MESSSNSLQNSQEKMPLTVNDGLMFEARTLTPNNDTHSFLVISRFYIRLVSKKLRALEMVAVADTLENVPLGQAIERYSSAPPALPEITSDNRTLISIFATEKIPNQRVNIE